ncbi:MAG TPA: ACP S-malonyltransferase [Prolixibacteraceae bacterium]|nr:ACP S-malonyltransferase [Prolixibacteraceae bacterium]
MKKAYIFPGQGAQYPGMGKDHYENAPVARELMEEANSLLGFRLTDIMFEGSVDDLKQTRVTQPAIFLHSVVLAKTLPDFQPALVAGHSLGEFSALVAAGALSFREGLQLVYKRALAMQKACEAEPSTMAAVIGAEDKLVEEVCAEVPEVVVPANYNCPGQIVISGSFAGIDAAMNLLTQRGVKRVLKLVVGGAFHSPLMEPAAHELAAAIEMAVFKQPVCPIYQNVNALPSTDPDQIRKNLVAQLTAPVRWTQTIRNMVADGALVFTELGPGKVLQGLVKKIAPEVVVEGKDTLN